jgi:cyclopropane fatty-acyl-phospholipid synthase-like methyltransferase
MTIRALKLIAKVLSLKAPPRSLVYSARNKINLWLGNGDRRFEFEKRYLERGDYWNYETSDYERAKYRRTMDFIVALRSGNASVLEVGCSVGVFTELLAAQFEQVTAIDVSREALALAAQRHARPNIRFLRSDIRGIPATSRYDVIVCAEILYYLPEEDVARVLNKLADLLSDRGIVVTVSGVAGSRSDARYFDDWNDALAERFERLALNDIEDPNRPYRLAAFGIDHARAQPPTKWSGPAVG